MPLGIVMKILTTMKKNSIRVPCSLVLPYTKEYCSIGPKYQHIIFLSDLVEIWPLFTIEISVWDPNFVQWVSLSHNLRGAIESEPRILPCLTKIHCHSIILFNRIGETKHNQLSEKQSNKKTNKKGKQKNAFWSIHVGLPFISTLITESENFPLNFY